MGGDLTVVHRHRDPAHVFPAFADLVQVDAARAALSPVGIGGMLGDRQIRCVAKDFIEHVVGFTAGGADHLGVWAR